MSYILKLMVNNHFFIDVLGGGVKGCLPTSCFQTHHFTNLKKSWTFWHLIKNMMKVVPNLLTRPRNGAQLLE